MTEGEHYPEVPGPNQTSVLFRRLPAEPRLTAVDRRSIRYFARTLSQTVGGTNAYFTCLITRDDELRRLNKSFLNHDYPTDVLSFPTESPDGELGEMAISLDRAREQAADFGHSLLPEIQILMLHGFLHLLGLDHECDRGEMARAEGKWRDYFQLPCSLISRGQRAKTGERCS